MAITIELWEDSGPKVGSIGTVRQMVTSISYKNSNADETTPGVFFPIQRPETGETRSYEKYNFFKIYGTHGVLTNFRFIFYGDVEGSSAPKQYDTDNVEMYYKLTSTYNTPSNAAMSGGNLIDFGAPTQLSNQLVGTTGPEAAFSSVGSIIDGTYYSQYLVTQINVLPDVWDKYGNIGEVGIKWWFNEFEGSEYQ